MTRRLLLASALVVAALAQDSSTTTASDLTGSSRSSSTISTNTIAPVSVSFPGSIVTNPSSLVPTGSYQLLTGSQIAAVTELTSSATMSISSNSSSSTSSNPLQLVGATATPTMTMNGTTSATSSSATTTNTQACNNYPEFCNRKYSNITEVAAHNAAFVKPNNAFSNQEIQILGQLNDGIRMIQGETHYANNTIYNCHSNCNFLNTGPYLDTLTTVRRWLDVNPYEVVTLLIVNSDYRNVTDYAPDFEASGILDYIYLPPKRPMRLGDWPTLGEMILANTRVVVFMDYMADYQQVPYILDEFAQMWETPFSPTDPAFPCTQQRPPGLSRSDARNEYLYLANHNLNVQLSLTGSSILIPNFADLNLVNANNNSDPSLLTMANTCVNDWNRPPNFLLVDFYDQSNDLGAVFQVAAAMNNVTYTRSCCGLSTGLSSKAADLRRASWPLLNMAGALALAGAAFMV